MRGAPAPSVYHDLGDNSRKRYELTKKQMQEYGYYGAFGECYTYLQRFCDVMDSEQYWNAAVAEASRISRQYGNTQAGKLTTAVLVAIFDELQRNYEVKYQGGTQ